MSKILFQRLILYLLSLPCCTTVMVHTNITFPKKISSPTRDEDIVSSFLSQANDANTENKETGYPIFSTIYNWLHLVLKESGHFDIPSVDETSAKSGKSKSTKKGADQKSKSVSFYLKQTFHVMCESFPNRSTTSILVKDTRSLISTFYGT